MRAFPSKAHDTGPLPAAPKSPTIAALLGILAATIACCLPAIDAPFTFDETAGIADN